MFKTGEKSHLCQNDETFFCSNLYRSVEITDLYRSLQNQTITITYSKLTAITKSTPTNNVAEILQKTTLHQHIDQPRMLPHVKFYRPKRSQYGKRAPQSLTATSVKFK